MSDIFVQVTSFPGHVGCSERAESVDDAMAKGRAYAVMYLQNDERREYVTIEPTELCESCKGSGEKPQSKRTKKERATWPLPKCERCDGRGVIGLAPIATIRRNDLTT